MFEAARREGWPQTGAFEASRITTQDPNHLWDEQLDAHRRSHGGADCAAYWDDPARARHYVRMAERFQAERVAWTLNLLPLGARSRVLDVGSGPGTLALPLASRVAHVTAVDPSHAMMALLRDRLRTRGWRHVSVVRKRWEHIDMTTDLQPPYDVVLASLCFGMWDLRGAIQKMIDVCCGRICLCWFSGRPSWEDIDERVVRALGRSPGSPLPRMDLLLRVVHCLGVSPHLVDFTYRHVDAYGSIDEAVDAYCRRYGVTTGPMRDRVRQIIEPHLEIGADEALIRGHAPCTCVCWDVDGAGAKSSSIAGG